MITKRLTRTKHGDPLLTIKVEGTSDVYRFAHHLTHGQVEFARVGRRSLRSLKKQLGPKRYQWLLRYFHGDGGYR